MTVVAQILDRMCGVAKPQRNFFLSLMATMLITRTRLNFLNLKRTAPHFPETVKYGVVDGFYAKEKFVTGVRDLGYHLISKLRTDARLRDLYEGAQKKRGRPRK